MKLLRKPLLTAALLVLATGAAAQMPAESIVVRPDTPVFVRTDGLPAFLAERLERESQKGLKPLRDYIERTRFMHQLDLDSVLMTREQARRAAESSKDIRLVEIAQAR